MKIIGLSDRYYPSEDNPDNPPVSRCVLVEGDIGDYAAYVGHGSKEWVAAHGDKISFSEAAAQFMGIEKEKYRE